MRTPAARTVATRAVATVETFELWTRPACVAERRSYWTPFADSCWACAIRNRGRSHKVGSRYVSPPTSEGSISTGITGSQGPTGGAEHRRVPRGRANARRTCRSAREGRARVTPERVLPVQGVRHADHS